jgi:capsular exopolysaccharide synthesis family protein
VPCCVAGSIAAWHLQVQKYTATFVLRLAPTEKPLVFDPADAKPQSNNAFEVYKRTQRQWMRSRFVLLSALRGENDDGTRNDLAKLPVFRDEPDPIDWLEENLNVSFPDESEVMHVSLSNDRPEGLVDLVNAVVKAYFDEIVYAEGGDKRARLDGLDKAYHQAEDNLRAKRNEFKLLADRVGTGDEKALTLAQQNSINQFATFQHKLAEVRINVLQARVDLDAAEKLSSGEIEVSEHDLLQAMKSDPAAGKLTDRKQNAINLFEKMKKAKQGNTKHLAKDTEVHEQAIRDIDDLIAQRKAALEPEVLELKRQAAMAGIDTFKRKLEGLTAQEEQLKVTANQLEAEMKSIGKSSVEVEMMRLDLATLDEIARGLSREYERTKVEVAADQRAGVARVTRKSPAQTARLQPQKTRVAKTVGAGTIAFFLPMGLIVWLDARKRHINSKIDVEHDLGLSVLGSVPLIPQRVMRRLDNPSSREQFWQTLLSESVDSIAAVLLRGAESGACHMVMVSSANSGEGKTTLAAHLATSLAGAGCRTVLVDFDLRRPALHRVLGLSLQPGMAELLRDGTQFEAAIQATEIPNLMFIAAGRTNGFGLAGLAKADFKVLFDQLRAEFEFVVVDGSPILPVVDTRLIAQHVDAVVLSVLRDVSCTPQVRAACQLLEVFNVPILGVVVTGSRGDVYHAQYEPLSEVKAI